MRLRRTLTLTGAAMAAVLTGGCTEGGAGSEQSGLPCEVDEVLERNCRQCHSDPPKFGAPMPLSNWEQLQAMAVSAPSKTVLQKVSERIHDPVDPMPPSGMMDEEDLAVLDGWIAEEAPRYEGGACEQDGDTGPELEVGPEHLPCEPTDTFLANADGAEQPYHLAPNAGNLIQCFVFESPWKEGSQGTAFAPIIDDQRVLHHWILWGTAEEYEPGTSFDCTNDMPADARFITGWAPGGTNDVMPDDVGVELPGPGDSVLLQVHYWNVAGYTDVYDRSGVSVCATDGPAREKTAAISTLGTLEIAIPPRTSEWSTSGTCTPDIVEPVQILSSGPHMHELGTSFVTEILRGGDPERAETLVEVEDWDFNTQTGYSTPTTIRPGDVLRTDCTYRNPSDETVYFGERTEDEMCFNFVMAYPPGALTTDAGSTRRLCID